VNCANQSINQRPKAWNSVALRVPSNIGLIYGNCRHTHPVGHRYSLTPKGEGSGNVHNIGVEVSEDAFKPHVRQGNCELLDVKATDLNDFEAQVLVCMRGWGKNYCLVAVCLE
jgi:hypothetical protein